MMLPQKSVYCEGFSAYPEKRQHVAFLTGVRKLATMLPEGLLSQHVTAKDFLHILKRGNTLRVFDWSSKTCNDNARMLVKSTSPRNGCYTGTIFNAISLQVISLKIVQCDITLMWVRIPSGPDNFKPGRIKKRAAHSENFLGGLV